MQASSALQQIEQLSGYLNGHIYQFDHSLFTTVDQVRLWQARRRTGASYPLGPNDWT